MHTHSQPPPPKDLAGYLDALARVMFQAGISWRVVDAKWPGITDALHGFDPHWVAGLGAGDIDGLMADPRVIRNRKKLEALAVNARRMVELDDEFGGFANYLDSQGDFEAITKALHREFAYVGPSGAWIFLWMTGRNVPAHDDM